MYLQSLEWMNQWIKLVALYLHEIDYKKHEDPPPRNPKKKHKTHKHTHTHTLWCTFCEHFVEIKQNDEI